MAKIILMVGVPGSGKSTHIKKLLEEGEHIVLSGDSIRKELSGREEDQSKNFVVFKILHSRMQRAMKEGKDIIIDATNINKASRRAYINAANEYGYTKIAYFINTPIKDCIKNNEARTRVVAQEIILKFHKKLESPTKEEGFDIIEEVVYKRQLAPQ